MLETKTDLEAAKVCWDFLGVKHHRLVAADVAVILGSPQLETVTDKTISLYRHRLFDLIVCTGGKSGMTASWQEPEAAIFGKKLLSKGVSFDDLLFDFEATNMGQNIVNAKAVLEKNKIYPDRVLLITHHAASMRAILTALKQWSGPKFQAAYPTVDFLDDDMDKMISLVLGEIERIIYYPGQGFTTPVKLPTRVLEAKQALLCSGFEPRVKA